MKLRKIFIVLGGLLCAAAFAQTEANSAASANRRTAIRYVQLAKQSASQKRWEEADTQARLGLAYDDSIADLWYIRAVSRFHGGADTKAAILPLVVTALTEAEWVDYNRDGARIFYADLLSDMLQFDAALAALNGEPFLYSADAEYIRAKCYYNLGGEYIARAREKIDAARRIYPADSRFAELFFRCEYSLHRARLQEAAGSGQAAELPPAVRKIADAFILALSSYKSPSAELELYAAIFAEGEKQERLFKSFKARGLAAPLYAEYAVRTGLLTQDAALDVFFSFADVRIPREVLEQFVLVLSEEVPLRDMYEYLNEYHGTIAADPDGDGIDNLTVAYDRGRPVRITYDKNQDDVDDWTATCDFGAPLSVHLHDESLEIQYGNWPYIQRAHYAVKDGTDVTFSLIAETLRWSPFALEVLAPVQERLGLDFFFPHVHDDISPVSAPELLNASSSYTVPSQERTGARITVSLLDGVAQTAQYTVRDRLYAQTQFEDGIPVARVVDADGDGLFETTELYGFSSDRKQTVLNTADEMQVVTNLFGTPSAGTGFYVRMIQIDTNRDTVPDFTEEYLDGGGKIASWDTNNDGNWNVRYVRHAVSADGIVREESLFHQPLTDAVVTVSFEDGNPVGVRDGERTLAVTRTDIDGFYWIGQESSAENAEKIVRSVNQTAAQGVSCIVENAETKERLLGVRVGTMIFGELLPESLVPDDENE